MVCVVTKTFGEKTVRQKSLAVDVEEMVSELSESEKSWIASWMVSVLPCRQSVESDRGSKSKKWWTVPKKWWRCHDWDDAKLLNDDNNLELFNKAVKLIHRNRCKTALWRKAPAVELSHVYDQEVPWPKWEEIEVGDMSQRASVIESEDVEEESDEEDQDARDQCQTEEVRSRQGETEEQTQVEDQVEERTFHHQQGGGS